MRIEVSNFAEAMEERLQENDHKHHWSNYAPQQMFERLKEELEELTWALTNEDKMLECVDVATFAMMIWDLLADTKEQDDEKP